MLKLVFIIFAIIPFFGICQSELDRKLHELNQLQAKEDKLVLEIEGLKLQAGMVSMKRIGFPLSNKSLELVQHSAMAIGYDCDYKMASWVFHVLTPDVSFGSVTRTNDFRVDSTIACGTAIEQDYFLRKQQEDGTFQYDGFGFDRGHLAPSADFRWSSKALSESYYYSNMTPQRPEFNRESWANLEGLLRTIVDREQKSFYVITGPVLHDSLPIIERSVNQLRIPELHYKIIIDASTDTPRGMAFVMPNKRCDERLSHYVVSIDSVERLTGLNFFPNLNKLQEEKIEAIADFNAWETQRKEGDVEPIDKTLLTRGYYNTSQARLKEGQTVSIVGKVVSTKYLPKSQSTFLNLDQSFPNQIFTVSIWKDGRRNFSYRPEIELDGKYIVVTGKVTFDKNGIPGITVYKEEQIQLWEE
jgi:endonuclease G, mitochondrial